MRSMLADLEVRSQIRSKAELQQKALDTRIALIDLNGDGIPEVIAQAIVGGNPTGNAPLWVLRNRGSVYEVLLVADA